MGRPSLTSRVDVLEQFLSEVRGTMGEVGRKLDGMRETMATRQQVDRVEQEVRTLTSTVGSHAKEIDKLPALETRIRSLEEDRIRARTVVAVVALLAGGSGVALGRFLFPAAPAAQVVQLAPGHGPPAYSTSPAP